MIEDLPNVVRKTAQFLGNPLTQEQVLELVDHLKFENLKNNDSVNYPTIFPWKDSYASRDDETPFMRKGQIGSYRTSMSKEMIIKFDTWISENIKGTGFTIDEWNTPKLNSNVSNK